MSKEKVPLERLMEKANASPFLTTVTRMSGIQREEFRFWRDLLATGRFPWQTSPKEWGQDVTPARLFNLLCFYVSEGSGLDYIVDLNGGSERGAQVRMGWLLSELCTPPGELLENPSEDNIKAMAKRLRHRTMKKVGGKVMWIYRFGPVEVLRAIFEHKTQHVNFWGPSWTWEQLGEQTEERWQRWHKSNPLGFSYYVPLSQDDG
jgi:hypothetical protein